MHIVGSWSRLVAARRVGRLWRTIWYVAWRQRVWVWIWIWVMALGGGYWPARGGGADVGAAGEDV